MSRFKMSTDYSNRYVFEAEWYDKVACMLRKFYLYYYPSNNTIELVCIKLIFLLQIVF